MTTHTEAEALLLESNLIKRLRPRYNIFLRDDKSFACILVSGDHPFSRVLKHRGVAKRRLLRPLPVNMGGQSDTLPRCSGRFCSVAAPIRYSPPALAPVCCIR